ncbi:hypothetical protein PF005_g909 [Phytophthora fragariae]|uniref:DUF1279 domain-containing protein n=2 Tax=Phytophthora TaxID=4783 RepID=A0A6A3TMX1_9STRA|nr:hypothetical protein PF003_g21112 [Phytophthora fragariae]KAE9048725.1 hypothetical protein PR002_g300 [Phytophthora rubi]KAE8949782.1 hypothetical protein PF009_g690 [Phytophthora fragariae]KAE9026493.1 hypothetical protein PF011_g2536 [Phytophthora fragariae]KAE9052688.1 hypothetical protein PR001_g276 [Phytophthora rubi]
MLGASCLAAAVARRAAPRALFHGLPGLPASSLRFFAQPPPRARSSRLVARCSSSISQAEPTTHLGRLKDLWRKYGVVAIGTYMSMYGVVLGSMYLAIDQGWVHTAKRSSSKGEGQADESFNLVTTTNKFVKIAEDLGIAQYLEVERVNSKTGTFLLAWIATKFTEPVRLAVTLAVTPRIARFLGRAPKLPPKVPRTILRRKQQVPEEQPKA